MKTLKLLIELEYDDDLMHGADKAATEWFNNEVLKGNLFLDERGELDDTIGTVKILEVL
jgi:hypothetical protein